MTDADWRGGRTQDELMAMLGYIQSSWSEQQRRLFGAACLRQIWDLLTDGRLRELVEAVESFACGHTSRTFLDATADRLPQIPNRPPYTRRLERPDITPDLDRVEFHPGGLITEPVVGRPQGILNFEQLAYWVQQTHYAVRQLVESSLRGMCLCVADARADHAAERVATPAELATRQRALVQAEVAMRQQQADAFHRGMRDEEVKLRSASHAVAEAQERVAELEHADRTARETAADAARTAEFAAQADLLRCIAGNPFRSVAFDPRWRSETVMSLARGIVAERAFDRMPILADALEEAGCDHPDVLSHCRTPGPHALGCWVLGGVAGS